MHMRMHMQIYMNTCVETETTLVQVDLRGETVDDVTFDSTRLAWADARGASFRRSEFWGGMPMQNLLAQGADFREAVFEEANFALAHLEGADFTGAFIGNSIFKGAYVNNTVFIDCTGISLRSFEGSIGTPIGLLWPQG